VIKAAVGEADTPPREYLETNDETVENEGGQVDHGGLPIEDVKDSGVAKP